MNEKVKIGVIGVGHLGQTHARLLKQVKSAELAGIYDIDNAKADSIAAELGVRAFGSVEELSAAVEAVSIVAPTSLHFELAARLMTEGKHCFIEKPVTTTVEEAEQICTLAERAKVKVQVGHIERFNPAVLALSHLKLEPMFVECRRCQR